MKQKWVTAGGHVTWCFGDRTSLNFHQCCLINDKRFAVDPANHNQVTGMFPHCILTGLSARYHTRYRRILTATVLWFYQNNCSGLRYVAILSWVIDIWRFHHWWRRNRSWIGETNSLPMSDVISQSESVNRNSFRKFVSVSEKVDRMWSGLTRTALLIVAGMCKSALISSARHEIARVLHFRQHRPFRQAGVHLTAINWCRPFCCKNPSMYVYFTPELSVWHVIWPCVGVQSYTLLTV